jgi:hypothetical protein
MLTGVNDFERSGRVAPSVRTPRLAVQKLNFYLRVRMHGRNDGLLVLSTHEDVIT